MIQRLLSKMLRLCVFVVLVVVVAAGGFATDTDRATDTLTETATDTLTETAVDTDVPDDTPTPDEPSLQDHSLQATYTYTSLEDFVTAATANSAPASEAMAETLVPAYTEVCSTSSTIFKFRATWAGDHHVLSLTCAGDAGRNIDTVSRRLLHLFKVANLCQAGDRLTVGAGSFPTNYDC